MLKLCQSVLLCWWTALFCEMDEHTTGSTTIVTIIDSDDFTTYVQSHFVTATTFGYESEEEVSSYDHEKRPDLSILIKNNIRELNEPHL